MPGTKDQLGQVPECGTDSSRGRIWKLRSVRLSADSNGCGETRAPSILYAVAFEYHVRQKRQCGDLY